ncbi:MAG: LysM peptidoglycan-binding domain-containing M23 family metallopeptidase [Sneathiella sp.]|nr:LysM peptidoglycan-binding domain-containing M23 family metallopeptidase [Sneathiella sp.]
MRSSQAVIVPKRAPVVETVSVPANYSPDYRALSYHFVTVQSGDTLSRVAARSNVPVQSVIVMNGMRKPYLIYPGQQLRIPAFRGHKVRPGETLYAISRVYDVEIPEVAMFNSLDAPYTLMPGMTLQIPEKSGGEIQVASASMTEWPEPKVAPASGSPMAVKTVVINSLPEVVAVPKSETVATVAPAPEPVPAVEKSYQVAKLDIPPVPKHRFSIKKPPGRSGDAFTWPVKGKIISGYGKKATGFHNDGVNIAVKEGTPIRAAENGVVSYVGNEMRSFGNLLLVSHADGYVTAYGHTERAVVAKGDAVKKGEIIAYAGSTGNVTESQLHFEIRKKGRAIDPVAMLE